jgi:hypothetical protein
VPPTNTSGTAEPKGGLHVLGVTNSSAVRRLPVGSAARSVERSVLRNHGVGVVSANDHRESSIKAPRGRRSCELGSVDTALRNRYVAYADTQHRRCI